ncbi:MAG TPA: amino acid adenylation domain-containing protein [Bryobacteraceae bacterium]|nr:amino acid adenylation domain-containing protein [Bryobacteraceae bacterium]
MNFNLAHPFYKQVCVRPDSTALYVADVPYSYCELAGLAARAASALGLAKKVGVLASRSLGAYVGTLGACWCGAAYIPLNPKLPDERLARILQIIALDALIVDEAGLSRLTTDLRAIAPRHILDLSGSLKSLPADSMPTPAHCEADNLAYILFTSGTTGVPKGVMITLGSVAQFLRAMRPRFCPVPSDRVSQTSDLSFDVSVFEMFGAWGAGASVHVVPANQLMAPARFIADQRLTVWSSVPSVATFMRRMKMLKPGAFPYLRYSVFAGEALSYSLAEAWQTAAPSSVVENLYGPTEATVYCLGATVGPDFPPTPGRNTVPSGRPLPGIEAAILDESLAFLPPGSAGQLAVSGGQLAKGYYGEPDLTNRCFSNIGGKTWYLTGDLACQDERGVFHHLGRIDHQVKILGQRVELEEVEACLRAISASDNVAAIAWPIQDGVAAGIVAFTSGAAVPPEQLREALCRVVPPYMVPRRIIELDSLPLGSSGKIDRRALAGYLDDSDTGRGNLA